MRHCLYRYEGLLLITGLSLMRRMDKSCRKVLSQESAVDGQHKRRKTYRF